MSTKLVKKLLAATSHNNDDTAEHAAADEQSRKRKIKSSRTAAATPTKEEMMQSHLQSILSLDSKIQHRTSSIALKSLERVKRNQKQVAKSRSKVKELGGISNSRSSASEFMKRKQEPTLNKRRSREEREEDYFRGVAKALKKAKKGQN